MSVSYSLLMETAQESVWGACDGYGSSEREPGADRIVQHVKIGQASDPLKEAVLVAEIHKFEA